MSETLREAADDLREAVSDGDDRAAEAARTLYDRYSTGEMNRDPERAWDALDAAVVAADGNGTAAQYGRLVVRSHEWPGNSMTPDVSVETVRERLRDPDIRRAAAGVCREANLAVECVEELGSCLDSDDVRTRRFAAATLAYPSGYDTEENVGERTLDLSPIFDAVVDATDDEDPTVRAEATAALVRFAHRTGEEPQASAATAALADALLDEDRSVRRRVAARLASHRDAVTTGGDGVDPETAGRLLLGTIRSADLDLPPRQSWSRRFRGDVVDEVPPAATLTVEEDLRRIGWGASDTETADDDGLRPRTGPELARRALTQAVEATPGAVADPEWYVEQFRGTGVLSDREARILGALAPVVPDAVAETLPSLRATLDAEAPAEARRQAAIAVSALADERPTAVSVDRSTLLAAYGEVTETSSLGGSLDVDGLVSLVDVDERAATDALRGVCANVAEPDDRSDDREYLSIRSDDFAEAVGGVAESDPAVARAVLEDVFAAVAAIDPGDASGLAPLFAGLQSLTPTASEELAAHADLVFEFVESVYSETRSEAALLLRAVGEDHPEALPDAATPLLGADADPESDAWPLGTIAASHPDVPVRTVRSGQDASCWRLADVVVETAAGDGATASELVGDLVDGQELTDVADARRILRRVVRERPGLAAAVADDLVERLASAPDDRYRARSDVVLDAAVEEAPETVRAAIADHYPDAEAFVTDYDPASDVPDREDAYRSVAEDAGLDP